MRITCDREALADMSIPPAPKPPSEMKPLARKAIVGVGRRLGFLALLLFVPAWSLRFWQGWTYWSLLAACMVFNTLFFLRHDPALIKRRLEVGAGAERERSQKIIQAIASVFLCAMLMIAGFEHRFHDSSLPWPAVLAADGVVALGLLIVFGTFRANSHTAATVRIEANQRVVATGPYAWVRHPMYAGSALGFLATPIALGSLRALLPAVLLCGTLVARLLEEERYLAEHLPGYDAYRREIRYRLIPWVW
jgi:protein-S-isoprenylcysteine O-methyltransferase Ste14